MRQIKSLLLAFFIICVSALEAHACSCVIEDKVRLERINSAEFIGIFKVIDLEPGTFKADSVLQTSNLPSGIEHGMAYKLKPIVTYKGILSEDQTVYVNHDNKCNPTEMEKNGLYQGVIVKNTKGTLVIPSMCFYITAQEWDEYKKNTPISNEYKLIDSECVADGNIIRFRDRQLLCSKETTDYGRVCNDNSECEGFCEANSETSSQDLFNIIKPEQPKTLAEGKCSRWDDLPDRITVQNGYIKR